MSEELEIRQAMRFLENMRQAHQAIQSRLQIPTAENVPSQPPIPPSAYLTPEEENRGYGEAEALFKAGDTAAARQHLGDLAARGALRWDIHNDLGTLLLDSGQVEAGVQALKTAVSLEFSSTHALGNLIVAYVQQGELANAFAASGLLLRKEPHNPDIPALLRELLLEASPQLDNYGWLSPSIANRLNNEQQLQSYITTTAPTHTKNQIKAELYDWISSNFSNIYSQRNQHELPINRYCILCKSTIDNWIPYRNGDTSPFTTGLSTIGSNIDRFGCPICDSNDRERHIFLYLLKLNLLQHFENSKILHIAPESRLVEVIESMHPSEYIKGDLNPSKTGVLHTNIEATNFKNEHFDWVICNHVLEHVDTPTTALKETLRILKPGGIFICQTPYAKKLTDTFESHFITNAEERFLYFGQENHLRLFGNNIDQIIRSAGFEGELISHEDALNDIDPDYYGVNELEPLFLFKKPTC